MEGVDFNIEPVDEDIFMLKRHHLKNQKLFLRLSFQTHLTCGFRLKLFEVLVESGISTALLIDDVQLIS